MPLRVQDDLPAKSILEDEHIFVMTETRALSQDIRPLKIVILNLMPLKEDTELHLLRSLSNTPLQVDLSFLTMASHKSTHTSTSHINKFYEEFKDIRKKKFDGMIITGAPVELMEFEEVDYWNEIVEIFEWTKTHVTSTFFICWGAQAALYHFYGISKHKLDQKLFGVFEHRVLERKIPLVRGFDDVFLAPHSRNTTVLREDIEKHPELTILAESDKAGVFLLMEGEGSKVFVMGHPEYDRITLDKEYRRDTEKGIPIQLPENYYPDDDPNHAPVLTWRANANNLYSNWLNYYVYQITPYTLEEEED